jgi:hypothetical protein
MNTTGTLGESMLTHRNRSSWSRRPAPRPLNVGHAGDVRDAVGAIDLRLHAGRPPTSCPSREQYAMLEGKVR